MRLGVSGSRNWDDYNRLAEVIARLKPTIVVVGDATGADTLAVRWCDETDTECIVYCADWQKHGKAAGPLRNQRIVDFGLDYWVAFPLPGSRGTYDFIRRATKAGVPGYVCAWPPQEE